MEGATEPKDLGRQSLSPTFATINTGNKIRLLEKISFCFIGIANIQKVLVTRRNPRWLISMLILRLGGTSPKSSSSFSQKATDLAKQ